jgi:hypothetical protein
MAGTPCPEPAPGLGLPFGFGHAAWFGDGDGGGDMASNVKETGNREQKEEERRKKKSEGRLGEKRKTRLYCWTKSGTRAYKPHWRASGRHVQDTGKRQRRDKMGARLNGDVEMGQIKYLVLRLVSTSPNGGQQAEPKKKIK